MNSLRIPCKRAGIALFFFVCLWGVTFASESPAWAQDSKTIRLVAFDYPPFYQMRGNALEGIAVDLGQQLFDRLGIRPEFSGFPLKRALDMLRNGEADAIIILIKTPEREEFLHFTEPVLTVRGLIWAAANRKKEAVHFDKLEDLKKYRIGVTRGYSYGPEFDALLTTMNVDVANRDYLNYLKLIEGRIDIFPGNEIVAGGLFKEHPELRSKLVHSSKSFIEWELRIAVSKKSPYASMLPEINAVLSDLKREGIVDGLVGKYTR